jgi:hypothetical protein
MCQWKCLVLKTPGNFELYFRHVPDTLRNLYLILKQQSYLSQERRLWSHFNNLNTMNSLGIRSCCNYLLSFTLHDAVCWTKFDPERKENNVLLIYVLIRARHFLLAGDFILRFNVIIYASVRCQIAVHQECYGARNVQDFTSWVCKACETPDIKRECCLCPVKGLFFGQLQGNSLFILGLSQLQIEVAFHYLIIACFCIKWFKASSLCAIFPKKMYYVLIVLLNSYENFCSCFWL